MISGCIVSISNEISLRNKKKHDSKFKSAIQLVNTCSKLEVKALD